MVESVEMSYISKYRNAEICATPHIYIYGFVLLKCVYGSTAIKRNIQDKNNHYNNVEKRLAGGDERVRSIFTSATVNPFRFNFKYVNFTRVIGGQFFSHVHDILVIYTYLL